MVWTLADEKGKKARKGLFCFSTFVKMVIYLLCIEEAADLNNLSVKIEFEYVDILVVEGITCKTTSKQISQCSCHIRN